ncbi:hypothetical protein ACTXG5_21960 [Mycobacterium sp. Dal123C01]|uniref:hypothetical protein n=1 Tax=Mycobacterium sp. Dal123C01 TaxID=3457577 RepID=UPI00403EA2FC
MSSIDAPTDNDPLTPKTGLTAFERKKRSEKAVHTQWAKETNRTARTAAARGNSPSSLRYHEKQIDPDGLLLPAERRKRAESARKAYFADLALRSAKARRRKAGGAA